jgi:hypothetical protein
MKKLLLSIFLGATFLVVNAQIKSLPLENDPKQILTENTGSFFVLDSKETLTKYSMEAQKLYAFEERALGGVNKIDLTDPFRISLYYKNVNKVVVLDDKLIKISEINLNAFGINAATAFAVSPEKSAFYVSDMNAMTIKKISNRGELLLESTPLFPEDGMVKDILIAGTYIVVLTETGIRVFDNNLQSEIQRIVGQRVDNVQIIQGQIFTTLEGKRKLINIETGVIEDYELGDKYKGEAQTFVTPHRIFTFTDKKIWWWD